MGRFTPLECILMGRQHEDSSDAFVMEWYLLHQSLAERREAFSGWQYCVCPHRRRNPTYGGCIAVAADSFADYTKWYVSANTGMVFSNIRLLNKIRQKSMSGLSPTDEASQNKLLYTGLVNMYTDPGKESVLPRVRLPFFDRNIPEA